MILKPSFYFAVMICSLLGYLPVRSFVLSIGPQGFSPSKSPLFSNITDAMERLFGEMFLEHLFSEGPFLFALYCSFFPMILFMLISSMIIYHQHKDQKVMELLRFGSFNSSSYIISIWLKEIISIFIFLAYLTFFFFIIAGLNNLVLGTIFLNSLFSILFITALLCAYGKFATVLVESPLESISILVGGLLIFLFIQLGNYSIVSENIRTISSTLSLIVKWISPFYYIDVIQTGLTLSSPQLIIFGISGSLFLSLIILWLSIRIMTNKEMKA